MVDQNEYLKKGYTMPNGVIVTPEFRVSYPFLSHKRKGKNGKEGKFSLNMLFAVGADLTILQTACAGVMVKQFGQDRNQWPSPFKHPFKSQTDRVGKDKGYEKDGVYIIGNSLNPPGLVDANVRPLLNPSDIYAGCYGVAMVRFYWYSNEQKGVGCELINFQKTRDGEPIGNRTTPEMGFQAVGGGEGANQAAGFMPQGGKSLDPFGMPQGASGSPQLTGAPSDIFKGM